MRYVIRQAFDLHVCFNDPNGDEVVNWDLYHRWSLPDCRQGTLRGDDCVLRCEARYFRDDFDLVGFSLRFSKSSNRVWFGRGRKAYRFTFTGTSSGGNMYWERICFPIWQIPHVLNWLRRTRLFSKAEWLSDFEPLWHSPKPLDEQRLRAFGRQQIRVSLRHEARAVGCSVAELIRLSMPHDSSALA